MLKIFFFYPFKVSESIEKGEITQNNLSDWCSSLCCCLFVWLSGCSSVMWLKASEDQSIAESSLASVVRQSGNTVNKAGNSHSNGEAVPDEAWLCVCQLSLEAAVIIPLQQVFTMVTESGLLKVNGLVLCRGTGSQDPWQACKGLSDWCHYWQYINRKKQYLGMSYSMYIIPFL